jgi:hypothetical protein
MLGSALTPTLWALLQEGAPADPRGYLRALELLPASWEQQRKGG